MAQFNAANARFMAARSVTARKAAEAERAANPVPIPLPATAAADTERYIATRLARVRGQLNLVDAAIEKEASKAQPDGQRLNWLAAAQERLAEQERILAGRPLPGSRRPGRDRERSPSDWLRVTPRPVPVPG